MPKLLRITITASVPDDLTAQHKALAPILAALEPLQAALPQGAKLEHTLVTPKAKTAGKPAVRVAAE